MRDRILALLGEGVPQALVATAVGCTESYVSQLTSEETFAAELAELRFKNLRANSDRDAKIDSLEDKILEKLDTAIAFAVKPMELTKIFQVVNGAKRRGYQTADPSAVVSQVVNVNLPQITVNKFVLSPQREIVEVSGQTLATIPGKQLMNQIAERRKNNGYLVDTTEAPADAGTETSKTAAVGAR